MPQVNPEILKWARQTAGLSLGEAARKIGLQATKDEDAAARLGSLEAGVTAPSRPLLSRMAKGYRRPLVVFYMSAPPRRGERGQDFRMLPEHVSTSEDAVVDTLVRDIQARQDLVRSALVDEDEAVPLPFIGSHQARDGVARIASSIQQTLRFDLEEFRRQKTRAAAFDLLRTKVENIGIFVLLIGDLGSHHTALSLTSFRGFALADEVAPFIVINDQDSRAAWSFTLLHELTHLWLGQTGISGMQSDLGIERLCNDVASHILLPAEELEELTFDRRDAPALQTRIGSFANKRNVSHSMVAYKLYRGKKIDRGTWIELRDTFRQRWREQKERNREQNRRTEGGPSYYVVKRHRLGNALLGFASRMLQAGALTTTKTARVLGVKPKKLQYLLEGSL